METKYKPLRTENSSSVDVWLVVDHVFAVKGGVCFDRFRHEFEE